MRPLILAALIAWTSPILGEDFAYYEHDDQLIERSLESGEITVLGALQDRILRLAFAPTGQLYAVSVRDEIPVLQRIDTTDASVEDVMPLPGLPFGIGGFTIDEEGIFWITQDGPPELGAPTHLLRYDPAAGEITTTDLDDGVDLLANRNGVLYGTNRGTNLVLVDPQTGALTDAIVGGPILIAAFGADFDSEGLLWIGKQGAVDPPFGDGRLDAVNLTTSEIEASFVVPENVSGLAIRSTEECSGLCLHDERFEVTATWRDFEDRIGTAKVVPFRSRESGLLYFFHPDNWEVMVKVLDGCALNQHYWVFAAATTNVEFTLRITDRQSGLQTEYFNPLGVSAPAITDTEAFATCP